MATLPAFMPPGFVGVFASVSAAPPAATYPMQSIYVTEGTGYFCVSNGVAWLEQIGVDSATGIVYAGSTVSGYGQSIAVGGVPMILQASGTVGNNGALSALNAVLEKAPESAKPALRRAIAASEAGYQRALDALD